MTKKKLNRRPAESYRGARRNAYREAGLLPVWREEEVRLIGTGRSTRRQRISLVRTLAGKSAI